MSKMPPHTPYDPDLAALITLFDDCFYPTYNTRLIKGGDEPIYLPASSKCPYHQIVFAHGFFSSALHEIAHWCIAGEERRQQVDFGYWYEPDGRTAEQQSLFESVEIKPQALEWIFSKSAGRKFRVSVDNLNGEETDTKPFKTSVYRQLMTYCETGLNERAEQFRQALAKHFGSLELLSSENYQLDEI